MSLEIESQLGNLNASSPKARARCAQCNRELHYVPFPLDNIMCKDCYGHDRYQRRNHSSSKKAKSDKTEATTSKA